MVRCDLSVCPSIPLIPRTSGSDFLPITYNARTVLVLLVYTFYPPLHAQMICKRSSYFMRYMKTDTRFPQMDNNAKQILRLLHSPYLILIPRTLAFMHAKTRHTPCIPCTQLLRISVPIRFLFAL